MISTESEKPRSQMGTGAAKTRQNQKRHAPERRAAEETTAKTRRKRAETGLNADCIRTLRMALPVLS